MRANWNENPSKLWTGTPVAHLSGGLQGHTNSVGMYRHDPLFCKPGLWYCAMNCGSEVFNFMGLETAGKSCVMDDFGSLVAVPS